MTPLKRRHPVQSAGAPIRSGRVSGRFSACGVRTTGLALVALAYSHACPPVAQAQFVMDPGRFMARSDETSVAIEAVDGDGPAYPISRLAISFREAHPDLPPIEELLPVEVVLTPTESGYVAPRPGQPEETLRFDVETDMRGAFHASAIASIGQAMLGEAHDAGLLGVFILPDPTQIDPKSERDLRAEGDTELRLQVWIGRIHDVRTVATGDRIDPAWRIDNPKQKRILQGSPLFPADAGRDDTTDLLLEDVLEEYVFRLNRHPGRQVEAALGPSIDGEGIALDYRVYEPKPWIAYVQSSNTGVERTSKWQQRFGYQHRQLSNRDDILSIEYMNAGWDDVNAISVSYTAPWFSPVRPSWMRRPSRREPKWTSWLDRSEVPWWGVERLRWGVNGGWSRYKSNPVTGTDNDSLVVTNDWRVGGELEYNVFQHRAFFIDAYVGGAIRGIDTENNSLGQPFEAKGVILMPEIGIRMDRVNLYSALFANLSAEGGFSSIGDESAAQGTGRPLVDKQWAALQWNAGVSHYLEPLFNRRAWRDPSSEWSSTLAHEISVGFRGQYAFDFRLLPQAAQVIGGLYSVRGFENSLAVGDSIYVGTAEYRFHIPRALGVKHRPMQLPLIGDFRVAPQQVYGRPDWDLILRGFVDAGQTIRNRRGEIAGSNIDEFNQTLVGAGVGLELILGGKFRARVDWGRGLYQNKDCVGNSAACTGADDIDPKGELNFLFSLIY